PLMLRVADAEIARRRYESAAVLLRQALGTKTAAQLSARERALFEDKLARAAILSDDIETAVSIYASFLELAGDDAARGGGEDPKDLSALYADRVGAAGDLFTGALNHARPYQPAAGSSEAQLAAASNM